MMPPRMVNRTCHRCAGIYQSVADDAAYLCGGCRKPRAPYAASVCGARLSNRERQVTSLVGEGRSNKEIATNLCLTEGTVKVYMSRIFDKTGCSTRLELALWQIKTGGQQDVAA